MQSVKMNLHLEIEWARKYRQTLLDYLNAEDWTPDPTFMPELLPNEDELDFVDDSALPPQADEEAQAAPSTGPSVEKAKKNSKKIQKT
jgi:hypothetical protein